MKTVLLIVLIASLAIGIIACSTATDVSLLQTAKSLTDAWLAVYDPSNVMVDPLFTAAITSLQDYKQGQTCETVVVTINAVGVALAAEPQVNALAKLTIATVIASVDLVASHYASCSSSGLAAAHQSLVTNAPATAAELKARWKQIGGPVKSKNPLHRFKK